MKFENQALGPNFDAQSVKTNDKFAWSAVGEMNNQELDQLLAKNNDRSKVLEADFKEKTMNIAEERKEARKAEAEAFEVKEKYKDSSINYPTYGRGLKKPGIELNTFMVQEKMCADIGGKNKSNPNSPKADVQAQQRKRILSPERQKYESLFEKYVTKKNIDDQMEDEPAPKTDFDTTTKPTGTQNALVNKKLKYEKKMKI